MPVARLIPHHRIPKFCPHCSHAIPDTERARQTHPFVCANPEQSHKTFVSPEPVGTQILFVRLNDDIGVVLGRRGIKQDVGYGRWALPGGFVDGETSRAAAAREFREEVGVDIDHLGSTFVLEYFNANSDTLVYFYGAVWTETEPPAIRAIEPETLDVQIFSINALPDDLAFPSQAEVIKQAARLLLD